MRASWYRKMGFMSPKPTTIMLQLVDRSLAKPDGIIEDVLVQVASLIFPMDFVILDFEADPIVLFILERPFLAIEKSLIDVETGKMTMRAHDKVEVFDLYKALKLPAIYKELSSISVIDFASDWQLLLFDDPLE